MKNPLKYALLTACLFCAPLAMPMGAGAAQPAAASNSPESGEDAQTGVDLSRMMREVEALRRFAGAEADEALRELAGDKQALTAKVNALRSERKDLEEKVVAMQERYNEQILRLQELEAIEKEDITSRKALEGAARLTAATARDRLAVSAYTSLAPDMASTAARIADAESFPSMDDIRAVTALLFNELEYAGSVSIAPGQVTLPDGSFGTANILRVGGLLSAARLDSGKTMFLQPVDGGKRLMEVQADVPSSALKLVDRGLSAKDGIYPVDFSEGAVFKRFTNQGGIWEHIMSGGALVWPILGLGLIALVFGLLRYSKLMRTRFGSTALLDEFFNMVRGNKLDEARSLIESANTNKTPVYAMLRHMLAEWRKGNISSLEKCRDEAILEQSAPLSRGVPFVAIVAAVAPLLGLLGTVTGMISTFEVITIFGNSDPKLLSGGISVALITTELGLITAIPLMFLHFALSRRVGRLVDDMEEKGAILIARTSAGGAV